MKRKWTLFR